MSDRKRAKLNVAIVLLFHWLLSIATAQSDNNADNKTEATTLSDTQANLTPNLTMNITSTLIMTNVTSNITNNNELASGKNVSGGAVVLVSDTSSLAATSRLPTDAWIVIACAVIFVIIIVIITLYLNKVACFKDCGGFSLTEPKSKGDLESAGKKIANVWEQVRQFPKHEMLGKSESIQQVGTANSNDGDRMGMAVSAVSSGLDRLKGPAATGYESGAESGQEDQPIMKKAVSATHLSLQTENVPVIEADINYDKTRRELRIKLKRLSNLPYFEWYYQVHVAVLPTKRYTFQSRFVKPERPQLTTVYTCKIAPDDFRDSNIRMRLYGRAKLLSTDVNIGVAYLPLMNMPMDEEIRQMLKLNPIPELSSFPSGDISDPGVTGEPTLEVGLAYSASTLTVKIGTAHLVDKLVKKGSNMETSLAVLLFRGRGSIELQAQYKSKKVRGSSPNFNENFTFKVLMADLSEMGVGIMVYAPKKKVIGWVAIGTVADEISSRMGVTHWNELLAAVGSLNNSLITHDHYIKPSDQHAKH